MLPILTFDEGRLSPVMFEVINLGVSSPLPEGGKSRRIPIERIRSDAALQAHISFWALHGLPARAAHVTR